MYQPIATIPLDLFVQITDYPDNPLASTTVIGQLRTFGGMQFIGREPVGGANFWAPIPTA
jgi:hypothetical protein